MIVLLFHVRYFQSNHSKTLLKYSVEYKLPKDSIRILLNYWITVLLNNLCDYFAGLPNTPSLYRDSPNNYVYLSITLAHGKSSTKQVKYRQTVFTPCSSLNSLLRYQVISCWNSNGRTKTSNAYNVTLAYLYGLHKHTFPTTAELLRDLRTAWYRLDVCFIFHSKLAHLNITSRVL